MKWQEVSKKLVAYLLVGTLTVTGFLTLFLNLGGITYSSSGDSFQYECPEGFCADSIIEINTTYWNFEFENLEDSQYIYLPSDLKDFKGKLVKYKVSDLDFIPVLYKKSTWGRKLWINLDAIVMIVDTDPNIPVSLMVPTYGGKFRPVKEGDTIERGEVNRLMLHAYNIPSHTVVKWSFVMGEIDIDPYWFPIDYNSTLTYKYTFANKVVEELSCNRVNQTELFPIYETVVEYSAINDTYYNVTDFIGSEERLVERTVCSTIYIQVPDETEDKIIGITIEGQGYIAANFMGGLAFYNDCLCMAQVPPGKRNWGEYPCREHELKKGSYTLTCYGESQ